MTIFNSDLQVLDRTMFLAKLDALLTKLRMEYQAGTYETREDILEEFNRVIEEFYATVSTPSLQLRPVSANTSPSYIEYNKSFEELAADLSVIFQQLAGLEQFVLGNFNFMVSERDRLSQLVRGIASRVDDYTLYSEDPNGNLLYFKDSFNDTTKIDYASSLLKEKQAEINTTEGIITLPVIRNNLTTIKAVQVQINTNSGPGGSVGNYQETGAAPHDDIRDILDGNPDTWFEYERVQNTRESNTVPLTLDLTFFFDKPEVINFIRINPNNFGTQTQIEILEIETSLDGHTMISIKDDIPIADFLQEDEANIFLLAPSTSKFAGQGLYTFTPRKAKFVHLILRQSTPYLINTSNGIKWRYAIGLRDVEIQSLQYEQKGEVISQPFTTQSEIQKVSLLASENPIQKSELADVVHQVSVDDGATWYALQPQDRNETGVPEILAFNTVDADAIQTQQVPYTLRHKISLSRNPDQFKAGAATLSEIEYDVADVFVLPKISPVVLTLTRSPIDGTVSVMNPMWGARALNGTTLVSTNTDGTATTTPPIHIIGRANGQPDLTFRGVISREINSGKVSIWNDKANNIDYNELVVWVDNDSSWTRVGEFSSGQNYKEYKISNDGTLIFGNRDTGTSTGAGRIPPAGSLIGFTLKEERLSLSSTAPFYADLIFASDGDKDNIKIYRYDDLATPSTPIKLRPGSKVTRLPHQLIQGSHTDSTVVITEAESGMSVVFNTEVEFVDGSSELASGQYSIDYTNGVIYSYTAIPSTAINWTVTYTYQPRIELADTDWDFVRDADKRYNRIQIYESGYSERIVTGCATVSGNRIVQLLDDNDDLLKTVVPGSIVFSTTTPFASVFAPIEVKFIDGETEFNVVGSDVNTQGWYSVDYPNGIIYVAPSDSFAYGTQVTCHYTHFDVCYNIAQYLPDDSFSVDPTTKVLRIAEREALKYWYGRDTDVRRDDLLKVIYDYVKTTRDSIEELEPYFTPIIRHYVLKVLTKE